MSIQIVRVCPFLRELDVLFKIYLVTKTSCFVQDISGYVRSTISKSEHKISKRDRNNILVRGMTSFSKLQFISCCNSCSPVFREIVQNNTVNIHCDCSSCEIRFFVARKTATKILQWKFGLATLLLLYYNFHRQSDHRNH